MAVIRELDRCVFCGGTQMTEEHLLADWVYRAFMKTRKPETDFSARFVGPNEYRIETDKSPVATAKVVCRPCNNEWLSTVDNTASKVLKPLIRGEREVDLGRNAQTAVAAWIYKSALILDAADNGPDGELAGLRQGFMRSREAGPGCIIYAGPAAVPPSLAVGDPPETVFMWSVGLRPVTGTMRLTLNIEDPETGQVRPGTPSLIPIPGYHFMVGGLWAYLGGPVPPVSEHALRGFGQIWPARDESVTIRALPIDRRGDLAA